MTNAEKLDYMSQYVREAIDESEVLSFCSEIIKNSFIYNAIQHPDSFEINQNPMRKIYSSWNSIDELTILGLKLSFRNDDEIIHNMVRVYVNSMKDGDCGVSTIEPYSNIDVPDRLSPVLLAIFAIYFTVRRDTKPAQQLN